MPELPSILIAALTGFLAGLASSIPVGPINLTIINEGARRGFKWAALIGFGATLMEVIYCGIAFTGFASFFQKGNVKAAMELGSFVFLLAIGLKFLTAKTVEHAHKLEERLEQKLHPHSAFMTGFVRVLGNPGVLLYWIVLTLHFISREWVAPTHLSKFACCLGVATGTSLWFLTLNYLVTFRRKQFQERTLVRLEQLSGAGLLLMGFAQGVKIVLEMAPHAR